MKYCNFFKNKGILILAIIFILLSIIHIMYASFIGRGLYIDGMWWVPHILNSLDNHGYGFYLVDERSRMFINFINQLPMNIAYHLGITDKETLISVFSLPLFLFPFLIMLSNFFLAKRSKRYDLVLVALFLYAFQILPSIMYAVVEVFLASSLLVLLYHYFVADIDYNWKDISIIALLCIISFSSTELVIPFGILLFVLSFKKIKFPINNKNSVVRLLISLSQLCASIVTFCLYMFHYLNIKSESYEFFTELYRMHNGEMGKMFYLEPYLVETVTVLILFICLFFKKFKINKIFCFILSCMYMGLFAYMLYYRETYFYNFASVPYRTIIYFIFPVMFLFLCMQEFLRKYLHKNYVHNFIIILLLCGICNTFIQCFYSYKSNEIKQRYISIVENSKGIFIKPEEKLLKKVYLAKDNLFIIQSSPTADFLCLTSDYKIKHIVLPFTKKTCPQIPLFFKKFTIRYDRLYIYYADLDLVGDFWDLSEIEKQYEKKEASFKQYNLE